VWFFGYRNRNCYPFHLPQDKFLLPPALTQQQQQQQNNDITDHRIDQPQ